MKIFLLTGVPGTGKTHIGDYLRDECGFAHLNIEDESAWPTEIPRLGGSAESVTPLMEAVKSLGKDTVITWGFWPVAHDQHVGEFIKHGARMYWLDGDRIAAKKFWRERRPNDEEIWFDAQIRRIDDVNFDLDNFRHIKLDTFDANGDHMSEKDIASKLFDGTS